MADKLVKMERDGRLADIHPSNVEACKATGWVEVKPARKSRAKPKSKE